MVDEHSVSEDELRSHLANSAHPSIAIDTTAVISRSRARRRPRRVALGAAGVLAVASLVFGGVSTYIGLGNVNTSASMTADDGTGGQPESDSAAPSEVQLAPDALFDIETCGTTVPSEATTPYGLALELELLDDVVASGSAFGTVRLSNTSDVPVVGTTASVPDVTLARDSIAISHSPDTQISSVIPVNLQPGQSIEFAVTIRIFDCTTSDTGGTVEPGTYAIGSSIAFVPADPQDGAAADVRSPQSSIELR